MPLLSQWIKKLVPKNEFFGTSGDIELFEKPSNINGFWAVGQ